MLPWSFILFLFLWWNLGIWISFVTFVSGMEKVGWGTTPCVWTTLGQNVTCNVDRIESGEHRFWTAMHYMCCSPSLEFGIRRRHWRGYAGQGTWPVRLSVCLSAAGSFMATQGRQNSVHDRSLLGSFLEKPEKINPKISGLAWTKGSVGLWSGRTAKVLQSSKGKPMQGR